MWNYKNEFMIKEDITRNNDLINQALEWADKYGKESFPREEFKNYRRRLKRITETLSENCSAAAYGESQVGKSYLMSSLLSTPRFITLPIRIMNYMELTFDPTLAAISTLLMLASLILIVLMERLVGLDMFMK